MPDGLENKNPEQNNEEINNQDIIDSLDLPDTKEEVENKIYDINISSINDVLNILILQKYDFVTFEPSDNEVKLEFRKNSVIADTKFIKYPLYSGILLKAKSATKLSLEVTTEEQEGTGEVVLGGKNLKLITKVVSSNFGEKLFLKATEVERKVEKKEVKKLTLSQMFTFILVTALVGLIVGGSFLAFIVLNAQTIEDVNFFTSLGISLNDINAFIAKLTTIVFSVLVLAETIILIFFLFKFFLTPKEFKKKKAKYGILSALLLIVTLFSLGAWMVIDQKIKSLPNWGELSYGNILLFDNDKLVNENFDRMGALLNKDETSYLIGPINIRFDLTNLVDLQQKRGITIEKYIWDFNGEVIETSTPNELIKRFDRVEKIEAKVKLIGKDDLNREVPLEETLDTINIAYVVGVEEEILPESGAKRVTFNAESLEQLGNIEWYDIENLQNPLYTKSKFITNPFFKDTIFVMKVKGGNSETSKLFIIKGEDEVSINGRIEYSRGVNDLEVTFRVEDVETALGLGFIEEYEWKIGSQTIKVKGNSVDPSGSSKTTYSFPSYGEYEVSVTLKNTAGETKVLSTNVVLAEMIKISEGIKIFVDSKELNNVTYKSQVNEYIVKDVGVPSQIRFDAKSIKTNLDARYSLKTVEWDYDSDGNIDDEGTNPIAKEFFEEGSHTITAYIKFLNRRNANEVVEVVQKIFIDTIQKEAIIDFIIDKPSEYVPVIVRFDGSKSTIGGENITKFTWDFGDGTKIDGGEGIVEGHIYDEPGDYNIKMTATSQNGASHSVTKTLILKPAPQSVKISSSVYRVQAGQGVNFYSTGSEGQIIEYKWDFKDGNISTEANPTHTFKEPGNYQVTLEVRFANKNTLKNSINIEIY